MPNKRRRLVGRVVSDKMQKTVVVAIERRKMHRVYKKVVTRTKKVMAHDESDAIGVGAMVQIVESRPLSRHKRWVVEKVLEEAPASEVDTEAAPTDEMDAVEAPVDEVDVDEAPADEVDGDEAPEAKGDVEEVSQKPKKTARRTKNDSE